ncbi:MAG: DUF3179 domain-containing protein [Dehalococcoidia bacterium]
MGLRIVSAAILTILFAAACAGDGDSPAPPSPTPVESPGITVTATASGPSPTPGDDASLGRALFPQWPNTDFSKRTVEFTELFSGCPGPDCIPALDAEGEGVVRITSPRGGHARFLPVSEASYQPQVPVAAVTIGNQARAYPLHILTWHEIINDHFAGQPIAVTFCPLCNTAISFERTVSGEVLDFGVSGLLRNSDLVMFDRQTESWWQQATGESLVGHYAGTRLKAVSTAIVSWGQFAEEYPDATVLSEDTGHGRDYGVNPYPGYDTSSFPFLFDGTIDERLPALERVVGVTLGEQSVAVAFSHLADEGVANIEVGETPLVVLWAPGTTSALDGTSIAGSRDVGTAVAYYASFEGKVLSFEPDGNGRFIDSSTGSTWDVTGRAVQGPLASSKLEVAPHANHFWFAFVAFYPDLVLIS